MVTQLYKSLTEDQKKVMAFEFENPLRNNVDNNRHLTKAVIGEKFSKDQQALIRDIFNVIHSDEYAETVMKQVEHDNANTNRTVGFGGCSVAMFGTPGSGKFEFALTGPHVTRRVDGDSVDGAAFGGRIFYGHANDRLVFSVRRRYVLSALCAKSTTRLFASLRIEKARVGQFVLVVNV